jgi:hypothetical protein
LITIASVPTGHRYVAHLDAGSSRATRLPDPVPAGAADNDRWWPPRWLEPEWLRLHINEFDLLHLHFGFESVPTERLREVIRVLREHHKPLVFTVHDLHNPHFRDNTRHVEQLDVLVPGADEIITLTADAATEIAQRWDVAATVIPHPHVAPLAQIGRPRERSPEFVIGVHAKSLRANLDPLAVLDTVVTAASALPGATVRVDMDSNAFDPGGRGASDHATALVESASRPGIDLRIHDRFDDDELWRYLTEIDVSILPYRFGTHSGWLEACHDLGTAVIAPDCGHFADQKPCHPFGFGFDPDSLARAVQAAYAERDSGPSTTSAIRERERQLISRMHDTVYARTVARASASVDSSDQPMN